MTNEELLEWKKTKTEAKKYKKALQGLVTSVEWFSAALDAVMLERESETRGKKIARLINYLEWENDRVLFLTLGADIHKYKKRKIKTAPTIEQLDALLQSQGRPQRG